MGYRRAGFDVIGVDINPQPNYPFEFIQADALAFIGSTSVASYPRIRAVHASPPCQRYSSMSNCRPGLAGRYRDLIGALRWKLQWSNWPYVIENVPRAPLKNPVELCGTMFGYELYRHRLFESSVKLVEPLHPEHVKPASRAGHWKPGTIMSVAGHVSPIALAREVMDINWTTRDELAEAIPPYYTEYVGRQLLDHLRRRGEF